MGDLQAMGKEMLSEREERLLARYFDGESSWLGRVAARYIIAHKAGAREFMESMRVIGEIARNEHAGILAEDPEPVDLWRGVAARIETEERAALFLGQRREAEPPRGRLSRLTQAVLFDRIGWAAAGAAVAAGVMLFVAPPPGAVSGVSTARNIAADASESTGNMRRVSLRERAPLRRAVKEENALYTEPLKILEREVPSTLEVDWMKSAGRVRMMQEPDDRSAIIWVKRRSPVSMALQQPTAGVPPVVVYGERMPGGIRVNHH